MAENRFSRPQRRERRKRRIRKRVFGTAQKPRLSVFRSHRQIYVQLIDDLAGRTLCQASTRDKELRGALEYGGNRAAAAAIGKAIGERARDRGVERVIFDRNGYLFHGRLKALADAAREAGLKF